MKFFLSFSKASLLSAIYKFLKAEIVVIK
jgi:hypothetical protein